MFLYIPAYKLAFTALTYSKRYDVCVSTVLGDETDWILNSFLGRALPIPYPSQGHRNLRVVDPWRDIPQSVRGSCWHRRRRYVHIFSSSEL